MAFDGKYGLEASPCGFCNGLGVVRKAKGEKALGPELMPTFRYCTCAVGADHERRKAKLIVPNDGIIRAPLDMYPNTPQGFERWYRGEEA